MYYVGIDLGGTNIAVGIVTEGGEIVKKTSVPAGADRPFEEIFADMAGCIRKLLSETGIGEDQIASIGIGTPGCIDTEKGVLIFAGNFKYGKMVNLLTHEMSQTGKMSHYNVLLLTGIGCPKHMYLDMVKRFASVKSIDFSDHHYYDAEDLDKIKSELASIPEPRLILTTEKDTTRLLTIEDFPDDIAEHIWVIPIGIQFMQGKEKLFNEKITGYVQKNLRNSGMA
jgi:hypothetical protein